MAAIDITVMIGVLAHIAGIMLDTAHIMVDTKRKDSLAREEARAAANKHFTHEITALKQIINNLKVEVALLGVLLKEFDNLSAHGRTVSLSKQPTSDQHPAAGFNVRDAGRSNGKKTQFIKMNDEGYFPEEKQSEYSRKQEWFEKVKQDSAGSGVFI